MKLLSFSIGLAVAAAWLGVSASAGRANVRSLTMLVMEPLAAPLSCPCVEGYAQRKYEVLASHLEKSLGRPVKVVFAEALETALKGEAKGGVDLIIGKHSVVRADAKSQNIATTPLAHLTGKVGTTTQTGLIVVCNDDPAKSVADLKDYRIFFGPSECDEKHSAAVRLLTKSGVRIPQNLETDPACSEGASKVVDLGPNAQAAAVISSYAAPLLEGCGTIKKGDLRVVGETEPVPFITAFTSAAVDAQLRHQLAESLGSVGAEAKVLSALESLIGFLPVETSATAAVKKK